MVLFTLAVYSYPALATLAKTGFTELPPIFAADLDLYLLVSKLATISPAAIVNPYYGVDVPANATAHLKFRMAFLLFRGFDALLAGISGWPCLFGTCFGGDCFAGLPFGSSNNSCPITQLCCLPWA